jgi:putative heme-binding domain-containing protein
VSKSRILLAAALVLAAFCAIHFVAIDAQGTKDKAAPSWIWLGEAKPNQTVYFRKEISLDYRIVDAKLYGTCDNQMTVYINGKEVVASDNWEAPVFRDVTDAFVKPSRGGNPVRNVIAVRAHNTDGPAGLLLRLTLRNPKKQTITLVTDETWRASEKGDSGWNKVEFDDTSWNSATIVGKLGGAPWNKISETSLQGAAKFKKPTATPIELIKAKKDFKVELLYSVPKATQGSWISMTVDSKGRLIVSDQASTKVSKTGEKPIYRGLYRITPPPIGGKAEDTQVEQLPVELGEAHGLLWAFDSLYVVVNEGRNIKPRGLWRVTSSNNDDVLDKKELLREIDGSGEHGPHAVLLGPDGNSLYVLHGNHTKPIKTTTTTVPPIWGEDFLVPRLWDASGHAVGIMAPAGCIYKTDKDGKDWELISIGYRNHYDAAFNRDGELFTFDSDMEWDMNLPWYRPTRVCHAVPGSEFGWRGGTGKMYEYHPDNLPPVFNVGPGSPTGMIFGYGAKFPAKYQESLFCCDWSYGKLYALHLKEDGASYKGDLEEFLNGSPLPLTDIVINPKDGAMYFTIGGRSTMSGLYRVTYVGKESTAPVKTRPRSPNRIGYDSEKLARAGLNEQDVDKAVVKTGGGTIAEMCRYAAVKTPKGYVPVRDLVDSETLVAIRKSLEYYYGRKDRDAVEIAWPYLSDEDRFLRYAARTVLEFQDPGMWQDKALAEKNPIALTHAIIGLARAGDKSLQPKMLEALERVDWAKLTDAQKIDYMRAYQLVFIRGGAPDAVWKERAGKRLDAWFPTKTREVNAELAKLITYLEVPGGVAKTLALIAKAPSQEEQIEYALALRTVKTGWTIKQREEYLNWFHKAANYRGGNSFHGFLRNIRSDAVTSMSGEEKLALKTAIDSVPTPTSPKFTFKQRPLVKKYTVEELVPVVEKGLTGRDYDKGRNLFGEMKCFVCHRFNNDGGGMGPDLTIVSGRFGVRDLLESIIEPSKVISDQYAAIVVTTTDGRQIVGRIVNLHGDTIHINTDMLDANKLVNVNRNLIDSIDTSKISMMPEGLIDGFQRDEILDLVAYLYSRGDRSHKAFRRSP